jgi:hypothetical protein
MTKDRFVNAGLLFMKSSLGIYFASTSSHTRTVTSQEPNPLQKLLWVPPELLRSVDPYRFNELQESLETRVRWSHFREIYIRARRYQRAGHVEYIPHRSED